jgi:hypothetical protein
MSGFISEAKARAKLAEVLAAEKQPTRHLDAVIYLRTTSADKALLQSAVDRLNEGGMSLGGPAGVTAHRNYLGRVTLSDYVTDAALRSARRVVEDGVVVDIRKRRPTDPIRSKGAVATGTGNVVNLVAQMTSAKPRNARPKMLTSIRR